MRVIVVLLFAAACGGSAKSAPPPAAPCPAAPEPPKVATEADLDELSNRFCDCRRDRACLADVLEDLQSTLAPIAIAADFESKISGCHIADGAIDELEELKTRACGCKDAACAAAVQAEFDAFLERHKDTKGSNNQAEKVGKIAGEMAECLGAVSPPQQP